MVQISSPRRELMPVSGRIEEMVGCANALGPRSVLAAALPPGVQRAEAHPELEQAEELPFEHVKVSEMQDETQEAAATSSPDPLTLEVPEGRDIDVFQSPPSSVSDSSEV
jgi:hypothetical protein